MNKIKIFIELTRLDKPIGFMLLFWPSLWGLTIAYNENQNIQKYFLYIIYFFLGSVLMRSAGCIVNDIFDKNFDKRTFRTKKRPLASGKISIINSLVYTILLCGLAFLILIQFNNLTVLLGLLSIPFAFSYPLMKRFTYWPQLFLGITFNFGLIMAWTAVNNYISLEIIVVYFAAIFWTLGYDTIYGYQDIVDDEIIGLKSTSIKFKKNPKKFLICCYLLSIFLLIIFGMLNENKLYYFIFLIFPIMHYLYQINKLNIRDSNKCLEVFRSNNFFGFLLFLNFLLT